MPKPAKSEALSKREVGQRIRALRQQQRLSQTDLAKILETHQTAVSQIELGTRGISLHQAIKLSRALHTSLDDLLGSTDGPQPKNGRVTDRSLVRRIEKIARLSKRDRVALLRNIDNFLKGAGVP